MSLASPSSEGGLQLLDGSQITDALANDDDAINRLFEKALGDPQGPDRCVSSGQFRTAAISYITDLVHGVELPRLLLEQAFKASNFPEEDASIRIDQSVFVSKLHDLMKSTANLLHEEPLVISVLDGSVIKSLLEDEDEFAMLAENLFTELDMDDMGKVSPYKLHDALTQMGLEMGVPLPSAEAKEDTVSKILEKYVKDGDQEIGQAQFAKLLQRVLEDIATSLAANPRSVMLNVKVNNGHHLKKMLEDTDLLSRTADGLFEEFDTTKDGKLDRAELRQFFEGKATEFGLPPRESSDLVGQLYDQLFSVSDEDKSGEIDKSEFQVLFQQILESFAVQLEFNPIFVSLGTVTTELAEKDAS